MPSSYQEFAVVPAFERVQFGENGLPVPSQSGLPIWSGVIEPPAAGACVQVTMNRLGPCKVTGYFVEGGYLGLLVKPLTPPEWYVKQNGFNATGHAFGAEIGAETIPEPVIEGPTQEQLAALQAFATKHGKQWKSKLVSAWLSGSDEVEPEGGLLRQVRNQFGHEWLYGKSNPVEPKAPKRSASPGM